MAMRDARLAPRPKAGKVMGWFILGQIVFDVVFGASVVFHRHPVRLFRQRGR